MKRGGLFLWVSIAALFGAAFSPGARVRADDHGAYVVTVTPGFAAPQPSGQSVDLAPYTVERVRGEIPQQHDGQASVVLSAELPLLEEAFRKERGRDLQRRQGTEATRAIVVERGAVSLVQVVEQVGDAAVAEATADVVTLRLPLLVAPGATLILDGQETPELRLSTDRGAFLINGGTLVVVDARITSWSEADGRSTAFAKESEFRPFIASYVRSRTLLAGSTFVELGYYAPTAYGVSLSSNPERDRGAARDDWPTGVLVGNEFRGLFYGFYSYEARDVAIVDNRYVDCIRYGIDPHDRSTRLVIARNTATGTRERHGIIGSRGVSHSLIVENVSHDNAGSGIMLDRQCSHNLIRGNKVYRNGQGIAIYESPHNAIEDNLIAFNAKSAIRVRNSTDVLVLDNVLVGNGDYAIELSARQLDDHAKRAAHGDLYEPVVEVAVHGLGVAGNRGLVKAVQLGSLRLSGVRPLADATSVAAELGIDAPPLDDAKNLSVGSDLKPHAREVLRTLDADRPLVEIRQAQ